MFNYEVDKESIRMFISACKSLPSPYKEAAKEMIHAVPSYFWIIPASTSGKYHPESDLGAGGLLRHSLTVFHMVDELCRNEAMFGKIPESGIPLLKFAALFHDCMKCGNNDIFSDDLHTVHEHPLLSSALIREKCSGIIGNMTLSVICNAVSSHMGQWNTSSYSKIALPIPITTTEKALHYCDYVASRKFVKFNKEWFETGE